MRLRLLLLMTTSVLTTAGFAMAQTRPPQTIAIGFQPMALDLSGLTAGASVAWIGMGRVIEDGYVTTISRQGIGVADSLGNLTLTQDVNVPSNSIWVAVDLTTGVYAQSSPGESEVQVLALPQENIQKAVGLPDMFAEKRSMVDVMVARKTVGAWSFWFGDGGDADGDGVEDGALLASMSNLQPVDASPPAPVNLTTGDLVVVLDPQLLQAEIGVAQ